MTKIVCLSTARLSIVLRLIIVCIGLLLCHYLNKNNLVLNKNYINANQISTIQPRLTYTPNLIWHDKQLTIHGHELNYRFGVGNPPAVALAPAQYLSNGKNGGMPYVTPSTELALKDFLADPNLPTLLNQCANFLTNKMAQNNPTIAPEKILPILNPNDVDIENYLIIDPKTGRKSINTAVDNRMNEFFNT